MKDQAKLIKKLRLKKGSKYILFIPLSSMDILEMHKLGEAIYHMGFDGLIVATEDDGGGIKVIEDEQNSSKKTKSKSK